MGISDAVIIVVVVTEIIALVIVVVVNIFGVVIPPSVVQFQFGPDLISVSQ